ncbi:hypothetical protein EC9_28920 [Rosistilla ulvae]|uniref:Uncharacterized protein n=1 Tax=Rosistilla ulvae TaxID=1930277 RepID=A0A517M1F0_9BACT|nr:hypothetical protein [Rosistilla ulvae]QDS88700.1 hypothetical protein EC9_28920 [Rosistilla ulvae]
MNLSQPLIYSVGTQVVAQRDVIAANDRIANPASAASVIVCAPQDRSHSYRVRFSNGFETQLRHDQLVRLAEFKAASIHGGAVTVMSGDLYDPVTDTSDSLVPTLTCSQCSAAALPLAIK